MDFIHLTLTPSPEGEGIPLLLQEKGLGDEVNYDKYMNDVSCI